MYEDIVQLNLLFLKLGLHQYIIDKQQKDKISLELYIAEKSVEHYIIKAYIFIRKNRTGFNRSIIFFTILSLYFSQNLLIKHLFNDNQLLNLTK